MKPTLLAAIVLLIPKLVCAQLQSAPSDKIIYLDSTYYPSSKIHYETILIIKDYAVNKPEYPILEYNKDNILLSKFTSKNKDSFNKEGAVTYYYKNGTIKSTTFYSRGRKNGKEVIWYENGNKREEGEYIEDKDRNITTHIVNQYWDTNGVQKVINGDGDYVENTDKSFESEASYGFGKLKNGYKDGLWEGWVRNPKTQYSENYSHQKLVSGKTIDENKIENKYQEIEKRPAPKNGMMAFYNYIGKNYKLPEAAQNLTGKIYVTFMVDTDGSVIDPRIIRDLGFGTGTEALRILKEYKDFIPGERRGQKVRCRYSLPITIQARDNSPQFQNKSFN